MAAYTLTITWCNTRYTYTLVKQRRAWWITGTDIIDHRSGDTASSLLTKLLVRAMRSIGATTEPVTIRIQGMPGPVVGVLTYRDDGGTCMVEQAVRVSASATGLLTIPSGSRHDVAATFMNALCTQENGHA
jgi:hypothetical protein